MARSEPARNRLFTRRGLLVACRNAVPVFGVYLLGWSHDLAVVDFWFDGVSTLAALIGVCFWADPEERERPLHHVILNALLIIAILGIPFWFAFVVLFNFYVEPGTWSLLWTDGTVALAFLAVALCNVFVILQLGLDRQSAKGRRKTMNWEIQILIARCAFLLLAASFVPFVLVAALAVLATWLELAPLKALKFLGAPVDPSEVPAES